MDSSSFGRVGQDVAAWTLKPLMIGSRASQSVSAHRRRGGFLVQGGCGESDCYWYVVGPRRGEGGFPTFDQVEEGGVRKREIYNRRASLAH